MTCPTCRREVAALVPVWCAGCDLDKAEAKIREAFGDVTVEEAE